MEEVSFVPRAIIWRECSQKIGSYVQETERVRDQVRLQEKELRQIDPSLLNEPRYNSDDWLLVQLVKTIYYAVRSYFAAAKIADHRGNIEGYKRNITTREGIEGKIVLAFNQAFHPHEEINSAAIVGQQFGTLQDSDEVNLEKKTNAFLDQEELNGTPLTEITDRCQLPEEEDQSSMGVHTEPLNNDSRTNSNDRGVSSSDVDEEYFSCDDGVSEIDQDEVKSSDEEVEAVVPLKIEDLFSNEKLLNAATKIFPFSKIQSIEKLEDDGTDLSSYI